MKLVNPYVAVQRDSEGYWQWRIECVAGFGPWYDHLASERAAHKAGAEKLRRWTEDAFERRSRMIAEAMDIQERRHGRVR